MNASRKEPELILVDYRPQADLMFWDQFTRSLAAVRNEGRRMVIVVGCGENIENLLMQHGHSVSRTPQDALIIPPEVSVEAEIVLREEKRRIATRLTDEGVSAVGILGFERGLIKTVEGDVAASKSASSMLFQAPGVMSILWSVGKDEKGHIVDIHPIELARSLALVAPEKTLITIVSHRVTPEQSGLLNTRDTSWIEDSLRQNILSPMVQTVLDEPNWKLSGTIFRGGGSNL